MSAANFWDVKNQRMFFQDIDADAIELDGIPINGGGGGAGGGILASLGYINNTPANLSPNANTQVVWQNIDSQNTFGTSSITLQPDNINFKNTSANPVFLSVCAYVNFAPTAKSVALFATYSDTTRVGYNESVGNTDITSLNSSFNILLQPNAKFYFNVWTNDPSGVQYQIDSMPGARVCMFEYTSALPSSAPTLASVLASGSSANNASITGLTNLTASGAITCGTLNYTTLNPPVSGSNQNLTSVLSMGNSAGGNSITNLNAVSMSGNLLVSNGSNTCSIQPTSINISGGNITCSNLNCATINNNPVPSGGGGYSASFLQITSTSSNELIPYNQKVPVAGLSAGATLNTSGITVFQNAEYGGTLFQNSTSSTILVIPSISITWGYVSSNAKDPVSLGLYITKTSVDYSTQTDYAIVNLTETSTQANDFISQNASCSMLLAPNEYFGFFVEQTNNDGSGNGQTMNLTPSAGFACQITRVF